MKPRQAYHQPGATQVSIICPYWLYFSPLRCKEQVVKPLNLNHLTTRQLQQIQQQQEHPQIRKWPFLKLTSISSRFAAVPQQRRGAGDYSRRAFPGNVSWTWLEFHDKEILTFVSVGRRSKFWHDNKSKRKQSEHSSCSFKSIWSSKATLSW